MIRDDRYAHKIKKPSIRYSSFGPVDGEKPSFRNLQLNDLQEHDRSLIKFMPSRDPPVHPTGPSRDRSLDHVEFAVISKIRMRNASDVVHHPGNLSGRQTLMCVELSRLIWPNWTRNDLIWAAEPRGISAHNNGNMSYSDQTPTFRWFDPSWSRKVDPPQTGWIGFSRVTMTMTHLRLQGRNWSPPWKVTCFFDVFVGYRPGLGGWSRSRNRAIYHYYAASTRGTVLPLGRRVLRCSNWWPV